MTGRTPPELANRLLRRLRPSEDALAGDLLESYLGGKSRSWYWRQVLCAIVLILWSSIRQEATMERVAAYLIGALALGGLTATLQGFGIGSSHWLTAAIGGPITGLGVGVAVRFFAGTNVLRWIFWMSAAVLLI